MRDREEARKRARNLVSQMTLEEKASQLRYDAPAIPRLGIPAYNWWNEGLHGVARAGVATSFPQAIGMAAAFDTELMQTVGDVIAEEGRAKYNAYSARDDRDIYKGLTFWSPNVNIFRDPRWGRGHETYGEDPYLTGELGSAFVKGLQGDGEYLKAAACAKHFAVHSGPEALRHQFDAKASKKDLYETYLPAFEKLVKEADVEAVMGAYNRTNGEPCCGSKTLMQDILRGEWGFEGHYVSDCWAIRDFHEHHMVTDTAEESAAMALKNGCDVNCGNTYLHLLKACQDGLVTEEEIGEAAERLFTTRFLLGLFDETEYDKIGYDSLECPEHVETAAQATAESLVLLKNNGILPLKREKLKAIGVIGPNADSRAALVGNYHGTSSRYITVLEGIQDFVSEGTRVYYSEGCHLFKDRVESLAWRQDRISEALAVAENSDVVILCLGLDETLEGEEGDTGNSYASGDKADLLLPQVQRELAEAVMQAGKPVILLNMTGSAMDLRYFEEHADAVMQIWYPGARGGRTVAEALFGEISPSGKLPVTFYNSIEELPAFEDYGMKGRTYRYFEGMPLYPFGYGLTYGDVWVDAVECGGVVIEADCSGSRAEGDSSQGVLAEADCSGSRAEGDSHGALTEADCSGNCAEGDSHGALAEADCNGNCVEGDCQEALAKNECGRSRMNAEEGNGEAGNQNRMPEGGAAPGGWRMTGQREIPRADIRGRLTIRVKVTNRSDTPTGEVLQVYSKNPDSEYAPVNGKLCGFARVFLSGKESRWLSLEADQDAFTVVNNDGEKEIHGNRFLISVGLGQPDARTEILTGKENVTFVLQGMGE